MKRFSAREFALLCVPVAVVAGAGWWPSSGRSLPVLRKLSFNGPKLEFRAERATALEAFKCAQGCKTALIVEAKPDWEGRNYQLSYSSLRLDKRTSKGTKKWYEGGAVWPQGTAPGYAGISETSLFLTEVPTENIVVKFEALATPSPNSSGAKPIRVRDQWEIAPSEVKAFDFGIPREPYILLQEATIQRISRSDVSIGVTYSVSAGGRKEHRVEYYCHQFGSVWRSGSFSAKQSGKFYIGDYAPNSITGKMSQFHLGGRLSLDNNWPLAFEIEPFDFKTAKVGQQLKFKSWPAPLPSGAKN